MPPRVAQVIYLSRKSCAYSDKRGRCHSKISAYADMCFKHRGQFIAYTPQQTCAVIAALVGLVSLAIGDKHMKGSVK